MRLMSAAVFAVCSAVPAFAEAPALETAAASVPALVHTLKKTAAEDKSVVAGAAINNIWHETRCMDVVFEKGSGTESNLYMLTSRTWIEECRPIGIPHGGCIPDRRPWSHVASFSLSVAGRGPDSPKEVFEVCMNGPWLQNPTVKQGPSRYTVKKKEEGGVTRFSLIKKEQSEK